MAGNAAQVRVGQRRTGQRLARPRRRLVRDNVVHNLITYLVWVTYLGVGVAVAASNGHFDHLSYDHVPAIKVAITAVAEVLLWPIAYIGAIST